MNPPSESVYELPAESQGIAPALASPTRPLYWSVQRELWENRSITIAPIVVAAVVMFGFMVSTFTLPRRMHALSALAPAKQRASVEAPYTAVAVLVLLTAIIIGIFYCLDALHGERRDRSILFWKSLPVSDRITVLSKAAVPLVVLPLLIFTIIVAAQLMMLMLSTIVLMGDSRSLATLWTSFKFVQSSLALLYALVAIALWHAPMYAWLLLISAWARRATFLWAALPPLALCMFEQIAFGTKVFATLLVYRLSGWFHQAFVPQAAGTAPADPLTMLDPLKFLGTPGLWIGLLLAAAFLAAAVRLRRNREPI